MSVIPTIGDFSNLGKKLSGYSDKSPNFQRFTKNVVAKIVNMGMFLLMTVGAIKCAIESFAGSSNKREYRTGRTVKATVA